MGFVADVVGVLVACVAMGSLVRLTQYAASKDVENATVQAHAEAIGTYSAVTAIAAACVALAYWFVGLWTYRAPDVPELLPVPPAPKAGPPAFGPVPPPKALVPVPELRRMMMARVTPRAPPPMKPVLPNRFR